MKNILVTGVGGPAGLAAFQYFQEKGFHVIGADMRTLDGIVPFRVIPPATDSRYLDELLEILKKEKIRFLIPTVTEELPLIAKTREEIRAEGCTLFIAPAKGALICNDKWETFRSLSKKNIDLPLSYSGVSKKELLNLMPLPILSKPRNGRGGRGVVIYQTADELPEALSPDLIYQEFLSGDEYDVNLFAAPKGITEVSVVLKKTALKSGTTGNALTVQRVLDQEIAGLAEKAVRALELEGPLDIDIRTDSKNNKMGILEINARLGANVRMAEEVLDTMLRHWA